MVVAISKASDQSAPRRSLIRAFASRLIILLLLTEFPGCENNVSKPIKTKIVSFFSVDHNEIFDHEYCIGLGNLLSI